MPYALRGTAVVRSDTGAVVKNHPTREKALAHLRALKANVEEAVPVLGALLDGFADKPSPDSWEGRFQSGDKVRVTVKGGEDIIGKAERPSSAKRDHVIVRPDGNAPHVEAHVDSVRLDSPAQHVQARKRVEREQQRMLPAGQSGPSVSRAQARAVGATPAGLPVREGVLDGLLEAFDPGEHPRGFAGRFIRAGHILTRGGIARVVTGSDEKGISFRSIEAGRAAPVSRMSHAGARSFEVHSPTEHSNPSVRSGEWQTARRVASHYQFVATGEKIDSPDAHGPPLPALPTRRAIVGQMEAGRRAQATRDEIVRKSPGAQADLARHQSIAAGARERASQTMVTTLDGRRVTLDSARRDQTDYTHTHGKPSPFLPGHVKPYTYADDPFGAGYHRRSYGKRRRSDNAPVLTRSERPRMREGDPFGVGALLEAFAPSNAGPLIAPKETPAQSAAVVKKQESQLSQTIADFNAKHPRSAGGRFASKGGTAARAKGVRHSGTRARKASSSQGNTLTMGTTGALVRAVQRQLRIPADGKYGPQTKAAVERYQRQHGLQVDGVVGAQTLAALRGQNARKVSPGPISSRAARVVAPTRKRSSRTTPHRTLGGTVI